MTDFVIAVMLSYLIMLTVALHFGPKAVGQPDHFPHYEFYLITDILSFVH